MDVRFWGKWTMERNVRSCMEFQPSYCKGMSAISVHSELEPRGRQDSIFVLAPEVTFFKKDYDRYTPSAILDQKTPFLVPNVEWGGETSVILDTTGGDLLGKCSVQWTIPSVTVSMSTSVSGTMVTTSSATPKPYDDLTNNLAYGYLKYADCFGHAAINYVDISIGSNRINIHYGMWLEIWSQLSQTATERNGTRALIGSHTDKSSPVNQVFSAQGLQFAVYVPTAGTYNSMAVKHTPFIGEMVSGSSYPGSSLTVNSVVIPEKTITVPLQFWFCRSYALALPLISLVTRVTFTLKFNTIDKLFRMRVDNRTLCQKNPDLSSTAKIETKLEVRLTSTQALVGSVSTWDGDKSLTTPNAGSAIFPDTDSVTGMIGDAPITTKTAFAPTNVFLNYEAIFLGTKERQHFAATSHEYLIEHVASSGPVSVALTGSSSVPQSYSYQIPFAQPIKELVWVVMPDNAQATGDVFDFRLHNLASIKTRAGGDTKLPWCTGTENTRDPLASARILVDGNERVYLNKNYKFGKEAVLNRHSGFAREGIYTHSFSLDPENVTQPSGMINGHNVRVTLNMNVDTTSIYYDSTTFARQIPVGWSAQVFAITYNTLVISNGAGGLAFSS